MLVSFFIYTPDFIKFLQKKTLRSWIKIQIDFLGYMLKLKTKSGEGRKGRWESWRAEEMAATQVIIELYQCKLKSRSLSDCAAL